MGAIVLPTRRDEAWRYSDLKAAMADAPVPSGEAERAAQPVIVQLAAAHDALEHVSFGKDETGFRVDRLETAFFDARALQIDLAPGADMTRIVIQDGEAVALNLARVKLAAGAKFRQFVLGFGARLARIETHLDVEGEGAEILLNAVYLCDDGRHCDLTSHVHHKIGHATTEQLVKGAVRKGGRGVFQGKITVARDAQKTLASQHHHALLLEERAEVFAKPELEIYADDVQCAHGNTAGALDDKALFYMRSRGIPYAEARALLVSAFVLEALPDWLGGKEREEIERRITTWMQGRP
jgi:Fe-S cluster assembly protein SufD